jgi:hypothetical protein
MGTRIRVGQQARVLEAEEREREHLSSQTAATVAVQGYRPPALEEPVDSSDDEHPSAQDEVLEEQHPDSLEASASDGRPATDTRAMPVACKTSSEQLLTNLLGLMDDELER